MNWATSKSTVSTLDTTLAIVHSLEEKETASIDELAEELDLAPSTVHRHLLTLRKQGYIVKNQEYQLGMRFLTLGGHVQNNHHGYDLAKQKVDQLAAETEERVQFIVEEHGRRYYLYTQTGENAVQTDANLGKQGHLHSSASGKAILAALPDDRVHEIIDEYGLSASTPNTITDQESLFDELEDIRESGVAFNEEESTVGLRAVGTAVCGNDGLPVGALSISGPARRFKGEKFRQELPDLILASANELELKIQFE
ncbi:IclR family transcriptional regulator [Halobacterium noricense]|uniref:IclR family transcriptional regulator n=1 Tax=Halobacterium noricense TaxID=223182 RepID=UPI001E33F6B4|nr:IclR family transcriptional regulator [Halobacterium noricense]UHH24012.1 IclR family transcriptional regulator [Halobacterium noricense]